MVLTTQLDAVLLFVASTLRTVDDAMEVKAWPRLSAEPAPVPIARLNSITNNLLANARAYPAPVFVSTVTFAPIVSRSDEVPHRVVYLPGGKAGSTTESLFGL